jgi:hypothetical protein
MTFGYSDAVDIFVNGQKVFQGDATSAATSSSSGQHEGRYGSAPEEGCESGRRESQGELRRLGRCGRVADPAALSGPALAAQGR